MGAKLLSVEQQNRWARTGNAAWQGARLGLRMRATVPYGEPALMTSSFMMASKGTITTSRLRSTVRNEKSHTEAVGRRDVHPGKSTEAD